MSDIRCHYQVFAGAKKAKRACGSVVVARGASVGQLKEAIRKQRGQEWPTFELQHKGTVKADDVTVRSMLVRGEAEVYGLVCYV